MVLSTTVVNVINTISLVLSLSTFGVFIFIDWWVRKAPFLVDACLACHVFEGGFNYTRRILAQSNW